MCSGRLFEPRKSRACFLIDVPTELCCDHDLVAERRDAFSEDTFHLMRAVSLGCVVKGDATLEGRSDDVDHLGPAGDGRLIGAAHILDAEPDARDLECAEFAAPRTQVLLGAACAGGPESGLPRLGLRYGGDGSQQRGCGHSCARDKKLATVRLCGAVRSMLILQ